MLVNRSGADQSNLSVNGVGKALNLGDMLPPYSVIKGSFYSLCDIAAIYYVSTYHSKQDTARVLASSVVPLLHCIVSIDL